MKSKLIITIMLMLNKKKSGSFSSIPVCFIIMKRGEMYNNIFCFWFKKAWAQGPPFMGPRFDSDLKRM